MIADAARAGRAFLLLALLFVALPRTGAAQAVTTTPASPTTDRGAAASPTVQDLAGREALDRLLTVLADDQARAALIAELEAAQADDPAAGEDAAGAASPSLVQRVAAATAAAAAGMAEDARRAGIEIARLPSVGDRLAAAPDARAAGAALLATILSSIAASLTFGSIAGAIARRLRRGPEAGWMARAWAAMLALGLHLAALACAWTIGYALATLVFADDGRPTESQTLYLNAFAAFALARIGLRALANPDAGREAALSPLDVAAQRTIYWRLAVVGGVVIQGFLFVVPLVRLWAGFAAVRPFRTAIATLAAVLALLAIRAIARALDAAAARAAPPSAALMAASPPAVDSTAAGDRTAPPALSPTPAAQAGGGPVARGASGLWRRVWPPLAVAYVAYAWIVAVTRPALAERIILGGTLMTAVALVLVLIALHLLRKSRMARAPLPLGLARSLPHLPRRADRIASFAASALAALLVAVAVALAVSGWGRVDLDALWARPAVQGVTWRVLTALLVAFGAAALWAGVASWIDARLGEGPDARKGRSRTLLALFRNAFTVAVALLAGMVALSQVGLDIAPLLAGAGVVGLAVGFGAQKLVQDIITGIFIQLENALDVGDVVGVAGITGGVEHVSIRSVRLRTLDGATHIIPFSAVTTVTNLTRDFAFHVAELQVSYGQDIEAVKAALLEAFDRLMVEPALAADILEPLEPPVVAGLREAAMLVRTRIKTRPGRQWDVGNRYSEILKQVLDERHIEIPVAQRTILLPAGGAA